MLNREKLAHILRASAGIAGKRKLGLVGSAAVVFAMKNVPAKALMTREADVFLIDGTESEQSAFADLISGSIGEGSVFHVGYGYYADGVEEKTAVLPPNWRSRALSTEIDAGLEIVSPRLEDLAVSKLMAWREKDIDWLRQIASFVESEAFAFSVSEIEPDSRNVFSSQEIDRRIVSAFGAFSAPISAKLRDLRNRRSNVAATVPRP